MLLAKKVSPMGSAYAEEFLRAHPDLQFADLLIPDMNGIVRGKRVDPSTLVKVFEKGIALPASIFALNIPRLKRPAWAWTSARPTGSACRWRAR